MSVLSDLDTALKAATRLGTLLTTGASPGPGTLAEIVTWPFESEAEGRELLQANRVLSPGGILSWPTLTYEPFVTVRVGNQNVRFTATYLFMAISGDLQTPALRQVFVQDHVDIFNVAMEQDQFTDAEQTTGWQFDDILVETASPFMEDILVTMTWRFSIRVRQTTC